MLISRKENNHKSETWYEYKIVGGEQTYVNDPES